MPQNNNELPSEWANGTQEPVKLPETEIAALQEGEVASLQKALDEEKVKSEKYLVNWQRAQADFINYKKRCEQEKDEVKQFGNATLILSILPVLDDLERALASVSDDIAGLTWVEGVKLILRKFQAILESQGISDIKAIGQPFDPRFHEAVMRVPGKEGIVVDEMQKGYKLKDRVIRPSMVVVGHGKEKKQNIAEKQ